MSIIAVNVNPNWTVGKTVKTIARQIRGNFDIMGSQRKMKVTTCYLRLSEKLDPVLIIENLKNGGFSAYIPKEVPDLPPEPIKRGRIPLKIRQVLGIKEAEPLTVVLKNAHTAILEELQFKYTKLYSMSQKTNHQLLESIALTILDRLKEILKGDREPKSGFELSMWYRRRHPHFGDLQLVLNALHAIQDAAGTPKSQLQENDLIVVNTQPSVMDNLPYDVVQKCCSKYSDKILKKVTEHIKSLDCEVADSASEEEKARARVRQQLKKLEPYMPEVYGEPALPKKEFLFPLMKRNSAVKVLRSDHMFNLLRFKAPARQFSRIMGLDSTTVHGVKLIVRSSEVRLYKSPASIRQQIRQVAGEEPPPGVETQEAEDEEYMDLEDEEEEDEE